MKRLAEDFKGAVADHNLKFWFIRSCVSCDYPLGFIFDKEPGRVFFDHGCNCRHGRYTTIIERTWKELADYYHRHLGLMETLDANIFFKFNREVANEPVFNNTQDQQR